MGWWRGLDGVDRSCEACRTCRPMTIATKGAMCSECVKKGSCTCGPFLHCLKKIHVCLITQFIVFVFAAAAIVVVSPKVT